LRSVAHLVVKVTGASILDGSELDSDDVELLELASEVASEDVIDSPDKDDSLSVEASFRDDRCEELEETSEELGAQLANKIPNKLKNHTFCFILFIIKRNDYFAFNMLERTYASTTT
jgi:hypothetical protein